MKQSHPWLSLAMAISENEAAQSRPASTVKRSSMLRDERSQQDAAHSSCDLVILSLIRQELWVLHPNFVCMRGELSQDYGVQDHQYTPSSRNGISDFSSLEVAQFCSTLRNLFLFVLFDDSVHPRELYGGRCCGVGGWTGWFPLNRDS